MKCSSCKCNKNNDDFKLLKNGNMKKTCNACSKVKKEENISKIHKQLIDPLISYAYKKINPYIITLFSIIILSFIIIIVIL